MPTMGVPTGPPPSSPPPAWSPEPVLGTLPPSPFFGTPPPAPTSSRRSSGLILAVVGTVLAVLVGAFLAWQFVWPSGGAGSPEEAVEKFIEAGASQDPLAILDVVAPAEVEGLTEVISKAKDRAEDEELVGKDKLSDAVELEFTDLEFEVDDLGDDLARVSLVGGEYDVSFDPDKLPERLDFLEEEAHEESESGDLDELFDGDEPYVTTVQVGGRWYVTGLGTLAEYIYEDADDDFDLERPDYDALSEDLEPVTGDEPEDVINSLFSAISQGDGDTVLASFPGDLGRPLLPYVPIVEDALDGRYGGDSVSLELQADNLDLKTDEIGDDRVRVTIEGGTFVGTGLEGGDVEETGTVTIDGRCVTGTGVFDEVDYTEGEGGYDQYGTYDGYGPYDEYGDYDEGEEVRSPSNWCFGNGDEASEVFEDLNIDSYFVVMQEVDGGYQLDPIATVAEYAALALDALDESMVDDLIERWEDEI